MSNATTFQNASQNEDVQAQEHSLGKASGQSRRPPQFSLFAGDSGGPPVHPGEAPVSRGPVPFALGIEGGEQETDSPRANRYPPPAFQLEASSVEGEDEGQPKEDKSTQDAGKEGQDEGEFAEIEALAQTAKKTMNKTVGKATKEIGELWKNAEKSVKAAEKVAKKALNALDLGGALLKKAKKKIKKKLKKAIRKALKLARKLMKKGSRRC